MLGACHVIPFHYDLETGKIHCMLLHRDRGLTQWCILEILILNNAVWIVAYDEDANANVAILRRREVELVVSPV